MLQKPDEKKQLRIPHNTKKSKKPENIELEKILNLDNFSTSWKSLDRTTGETEWETLQISSNFANDSKNGVHEIASFLKELFEHTKIGQFDYYHRAGKTTFSCVHKYEQNEGKIIEKFIGDVIKKEMGVSNIYTTSKGNRISMVFR